MYELAVCLVEQGHDVKFSVASFHGVLSELVVVVDACVSQQHRLVVLVGEVLRAVHVEFLRAQTWVKRVKNLFGDVQSIRGGDFLLKFHIVLVCLTDVVSVNLHLCDGVETVKKIFRGVAIGIANRIPYCLVKAA